MVVRLALNCSQKSQQIQTELQTTIEALVLTTTLGDAAQHEFLISGSEKHESTAGRLLVTRTTSAGSNGTADDLIVANDGSASDQAGITIRGTSGHSQIFSLTELAVIRISKAQIRSF